MSNINETGVNTNAKKPTKPQQKSIDKIVPFLKDVFQPSCVKPALISEVFKHTVVTKHFHGPETIATKPLASKYEMDTCYDHTALVEIGYIEDVIVDGKKCFKWIGPQRIPDEEMAIDLHQFVTTKYKHKPKEKPAKVVEQKVTEPEIIFESETPSESSVIENVINKIITNKPTIDVPTITDVKMDDLDGLSRDELFKVLIKDQRIIIANQLIQNTILATLVHQNEEVYSMTKNRINQ